MSLSYALYSSLAGIRDTETRISVISSNVTNADRAGYTRKQYDAQYVTTSNTVIPVSGTVSTAILNPFLEASLIEDSSAAAHDNVLADYVSSLAQRLGSISSGNTLSGTIDSLKESLAELAITPEDDALRAQIVNNAQAVAFQLNDLSNSTQGLRSQADQEIDAVVDEINESIETLFQLNKQIALAQTRNDSTADLEDERRVELQKLSENIEVDYFYDNNNQLRVYISGGRPLLDFQPRTLSYTPSSIMNSAVAYPGGISAIDLGGNDITNEIGSGRLAGLIDLRDNILPQEQEKLSEYANTLMQEVNSLHNEGSAYPGRPSYIGDTIGFGAGTAFTATGDLRIAVVDSSGVVQSFNDFDLSTYATVGALITDINAVLGADLTASLDPNGALQIVADNTGENVAFNQMDSSVGPDGLNFGHFFGMNNIFHGLSGAEDIQVSEYLKTNPEYLSASRLEGGAIALGDVVVNVGDGSLALELNNLFDAGVTFAAAGSFAAQTETLSNYSSNIISSIAKRADTLTQRADVTAFLFGETQQSFQNQTGVNVDEEMANLVDLEAKYKAGATMISVIQELFEQLIASVR